MFYEEVICAGSGGQGVVFMGTLLAYAGMQEGRNVVGIPSYGAEMRGGTVNYTIIISDEEIASPLVFNPTGCVVMNQHSLYKFENRLRKGGILVVNSSMVTRKNTRNDIHIFEIHASQLADELGNIRCANMVILGLYAKRSGVVSLESLIQGLRYVLPSHLHHLLQINETALRIGYDFQ